ncbi:hypothetical protein B0H19DRAFT_1385597 [Mycena capillaripes]|nr:hypothetical protein B0H19DRAFT_1385597 [Mycena capillaripes]
MCPSTAQCCTSTMLHQHNAAPAQCCTSTMLHQHNAAPAQCCTSTMLHQHNAAPANYALHFTDSISADLRHALHHMHPDAHSLQLRRLPSAAAQSSRLLDASFRPRRSPYHQN